MLVTMAGQLLGQAIGLFGAKGKASQENIKARMSAMKRSWTDEFLVVVYFSPLVVGWVSPERAMAWLAMVGEMPDSYMAILFAITGAVFGLGKMGGKKK